jgi:hypothetical protein
MVAPEESLRSDCRQGAFEGPGENRGSGRVFRPGRLSITPSSQAQGQTQVPSVGGSSASWAVNLQVQR